MLSNDTVAQASDEVLKILKERHPERPDDFREPVPPETVEDLVLTEADVRNAISSFSQSTAAGYDALRPRHLKDMLEVVGNEESSFVKSIGDFMTRVISGRLPPFALKIFYGAALTPFIKPGGGI